MWDSEFLLLPSFHLIFIGPFLTHSQPVWVSCALWFSFLFAISVVLSLIPGITICCSDFEISILQWSKFPSLCCNLLYTIKTSIVLIVPFTFEDTVKSLTCLGVTVKLVAGLQDAQGEPHRDLHTPGPRQACLTKRTFPALCRELSVLSASLSAISVPWLALGHSRSFHMMSFDLLFCRLWSTQVAKPA